MNVINPVLPELQALRVRQFLQAVPISRTTLGRMIDDGRIKVVRVGRAILISQSEVDRLLSETSPVGQITM